MENYNMEKFTESIGALLEVRDFKALKALLNDADEYEILYAINEFSSEEQVIVYRLLSKDKALFIFEELETTDQQKLLESFTEARAAEMMEELAPDVRVRLLEEMPATVVKRIIASLSPQERSATNVLMGYEAETAGRVMTTEYITLGESMTVAESMERIRREAKEMETIYNLYIINKARVLEGVISLRDLVLAEPEDSVSSLMHKAIHVTTDTDQEEVARTLQKFDLLAVPVVDKEVRMVGIITVDDAMDILEEEQTEDVFKTAGIADVAGIEGNRSETLVMGSLGKIWALRLPFLILTLIGGMLAGLVIDRFEEVLEAVVVVAVFIPIIMDMGGSIGTQSASVYTRGIVLGHIDINSMGKHFLKELLVGFSLGSFIGVVTGLYANWLYNIPELGLAVGIAVAFTSTLASLLGFLIPYVLMKFNIDQTTGTGPLITTIKDLTGLVVYFSAASLLLGHLLY